MPAYANFFLLLRYLFDAWSFALLHQLPDALSFALLLKLLDSEYLILLSLYSFLEYCVRNVSAESYYS